MRIGAALGLVLLLAVLMARELDFDQLWEKVRHANYLFLIPSTFINIVVVGNIVLRWQNLLNGRAGFMDCLTANQIGAYLNTILPLRMGDFARSYVLQRHVKNLPVMAILSSIGAELTMDMLVLMLLLAVTLMILPLPALLVSAGGLLAVATLVATIAVFALARSDTLIEKIIRPLATRLLPHRLQDLVLHFVGHIREGLSGLRSNRQLAFLLFLTVIGFGLQIVANWLLLRVFLEDVTWQAALLALIGTGVGLALPLLPSAAGTYELAIVLALSAVEIDTESATAFALLMRAQQFSLTLLMGSFFMLREGVSLNELRRATTELNASQHI